MIKKKLLVFVLVLNVFSFLVGCPFQNNTGVIKSPTPTPTSTVDINNPPEPNVSPPLN